MTCTSSFAGSSGMLSRRPGAAKQYCREGPVVSLETQFCQIKQTCLVSLSSLMLAHVRGRACSSMSSERLEDRCCGTGSSFCGLTN